MTGVRLLDLFAGAGGCAVGYHRAGFDRILGIDNRPQPRYPFEFRQGDALEFLRRVKVGDFDMIHASPPCQAYSVTQSIWSREYPDLAPEVFRLLEATGTPWVVENVEGCPMPHGVTLCGTAFGLRVYRHRRFASSHLLLGPPRCRGHHARAVAVGRVAKEGDVMTVAGHFSSLAVARRAMGIDWMTRDELAQAIPPAYTEWVGRQMLRAIGGEA